MGANFVPLLVYVSPFLRMSFEFLEDSLRKLARNFNLLYCYVDAHISFSDKDSKSSSLILTPKDSPFPNPQSSPAASHFDVLFTTTT